jgi:hypothetical protein
MSLQNVSATAMSSPEPRSRVRSSDAAFAVRKAHVGGQTLAQIGDPAPYRRPAT